MRDFLIGMAGAVSLGLMAPAFADAPGDVRRVALATSNTTALEGREVVQSVRGVYVWSISLLCGTAPCEVAIFDSTASGAANSGAGTIKWEGRIATNNGSFVQDFPAPLRTLNGLTVEVSGVGANAWVAYEP